MFKYITTKGNKPHFNVRITLKEEDKEIGFIHVVPLLDTKFMEILNVEVDEKYQRQGLGTKLYLKATTEAQKAGYAGLASDPLGRTQDATKLWAKIPGAKKNKYGWWFLV